MMIDTPQFKPEKQTAVIEHGSKEFNRVFWHSRRGMLELDLVLMPFVEERFAELDMQDQEIYQQLLACEDQDMFSWFMQRSVPEDQALAKIVGLILQHAQTKPRA